MPRYRTLIFDLDGTLVDSAPGILAALASALASHGLEPREPLVPGLIGPPLAETMARISGLPPAAAEALVAAFKRDYDDVGVRTTPAYPGIDDMLARLAAAGSELHVATNKRLAPSLAILDHLGLRRHFATVYALDMVDPRLPDKATLIARQIDACRLDPASTAYIGDKREDGNAAAANGLAFYAAAWGYGDFAAAPTPPDWIPVASPAALLAACLDAAPD